MWLSCSGLTIDYYATFPEGFQIWGEMNICLNIVEDFIYFSVKDQTAPNKAGIYVDEIWQGQGKSVGHTARRILRKDGGSWKKNLRRNKQIRHFKDRLEILYLPSCKYEHSYNLNILTDNKLWRHCGRLSRNYLFSKSII